MEHSVAVRRYLNRTLINSLGEDFVDTWIIEVLPNATHLAGKDDAPRYHRHVFFCAAYVGMAIICSVLLEGLARCLTRCAMSEAKATDSQREGRNERPLASEDRSDTPRQPLLVRDGDASSANSERLTEAEECCAAEDEIEIAEPEEEAIREHVRGYAKQDLFFIAYQHTYIFLCVGLTSYGFLNDYLCPATGLDYEIYFPWFVGTVLMHFATLLAAFAFKQSPKKPFPMVLGAIFKTLNPFDGHLGTLRDAVAAGIYAQQSFTGTWRNGPILLSFVCLLCIFLPNFALYYGSVHPFRDFQELYWPILIQVDRHHLNQHENKKEPEKKLEEPSPSRCGCLASVYSCLNSMLRSATSMFERKYVLAILDTQTRQHKQVVALLGDSPQAVVGVIFMFLYVGAKKAQYIFFVTVLACIKTFFVIMMRPRILCFMAAEGMGWKHLTDVDVYRAVNCHSCGSVARSRACRGLLKDPETAADARLSAIWALAKMHADIKKDDKETGKNSELHSIEETILWEYATSDDKKIQQEAEAALDGMGERGGDWSKAGHLMKRLRGHDLGDRAEAALKLATDYSGYANAYKRDLVRCLQMKLPPRPAEGCYDTPAGADVEQPSDAKELYCVRLAEACKKRDLVLKVRESAARSLGKLGDLSKAKTDIRSPETQKTEDRSVAEAVATVAPEIIGLLDEDRDVDLRMVALTAVVRFHGWAAVLAIEKAVNLLGGDATEILNVAANLKPAKKQKPLRTPPRPRLKHVRATLLIAKVLLMELLRNEEEQEALQVETIKEVVKMLGSPYQGRRDVAEHVLFSTGGRTAQVIWDLLFDEDKEMTSEVQGMRKRLEEMPDDKLKELKQVVKEQKIGVERLKEIGAAADIRVMNLMLQPAEKDKTTVDTVVKEISEGVDVFTSLQQNGAKPMKMRKVASDTDEDSTLAVFLTDLEPDDDLCITEVCSFLQETAKPCLPLIVFLADFKKKDDGEVFALKLMLAALIVGEADYKILASAEEAEQVIAEAQQNESRRTNHAQQVETVPPAASAADEGGQPSCCFGGPQRSPRNAAPSPSPTATSGAAPGAAPGAAINYSSEPAQRPSVISNGTASKVSGQSLFSKVKVPLAAQGVVEMWDENRNEICSRIQNFKGKEIRFYVCAPGRGNLGAIREKLDKWPKEKDEPEFIKTQPRKVYFYSGTFNVENMEKPDHSAMKQLVQYKGKAKVEGVLTDVSKYPFFGGDDEHEMAKSFTTFALPSFAPRLNFKKPLVAAVWKKYNDVFNKKLIHPDKVFQHVQPDEEERWKQSFEKDVKEYARKLSKREDFERIVKKKKRMTVKAYACDVCDAPLCDQLLFVDHWAQRREQMAKPKEHSVPSTPTATKKELLPVKSSSSSSSRWRCCSSAWCPSSCCGAEPSEIKVKDGGPWQPAELVSETTGVWVYDTLNLHTLVDKSSMGMQARRPHMREAHSISALYQIQQALQDYTFKHFENQEEMSLLDAQKCTVLPSRAA